MPANDRRECRLSDESGLRLKSPRLHLLAVEPANDSERHCGSSIVFAHQSQLQELGQSIDSLNPQPTLITEEPAEHAVVNPGFPLQLIRTQSAVFDKPPQLLTDRFRCLLTLRQSETSSLGRHTGFAFISSECVRELVDAIPDVVAPQFHAALALHVGNEPETGRNLQSHLRGDLLQQ